MIPEIGLFLLCLALGISCLLALFPSWGAMRQDARMMALAKPLSVAMFAAILGAFLILVYAFVVNDFTVLYVVSNSNTLLPVWYRVARPGGPTRDRCCCGYC